MKTVSFFSPSARALASGLVLAAALAMPDARADASPDNWWFYVHNDRAADIQELLAKGTDPNVLYTNGQPALMRAVVDGAWKVFDVLAADPRTDLDAVNPANETALMYLAVAGQTERAKTLIARGAQVNRLGWTPLHYAASKGHIDTAKLLIANKAMVNAPSPDGTTPVMMGAFSGRLPMVTLLIDAGADITARNVKGQNAADWAYTAKQRSVGDRLTEMIAQAEQQRNAQRAGQGRATVVPVDGAPPAPAEVGQMPSPVPPEAAPTQTQAQPTPAKDDDRAVGGVSGLRLQNYD